MTDFGLITQTHTFFKKWVWRTLPDERLEADWSPDKLCTAQKHYKPGVISNGLCCPNRWCVWHRMWDFEMGEMSVNDLKSARWECRHWRVYITYMEIPLTCHRIRAKSASPPGKVIGVRVQPCRTSSIMAGWTHPQHLNQHNPTNADSSINTGTCLTQKLCFCTANMEERKCFYDVIDDIVCYKFAPNYTTADVQQ